MENLNRYKITWAIFTPISGKFFKKNRNEIFKSVHTISKRNEVNEAFAHFPSKERAMELISKVKTSKKFKVTLITDKQFGMSNWNDSLLNFATKKQLENSFTI